MALEKKKTILKKPFFERNRCFLNFHKKLIENFLNFLNELKISRDNPRKLNILLNYITSFAEDEGDIYFGLQTNLENIAWGITELLLDVLEKQKPIDRNKIKEIELIIREELEKNKSK